MLLEVGCPCALLLGYARAADGTLCQVGVALQHPPTHLFAQPASALAVTGPRADVAYAAAARYLAHAGLPAAGQVEVELATPALIGLASEPLLSLCTARGLAWAAGRPTDAQTLAAGVALAPEHALAVAAFQQGGVLQVAPPAALGAFAAPLRRHALAHADRAQAWGFVLFLPDVAKDAALTLEGERAAALHAAAPALSPATGQTLDAELWPALERDDLTAFGRALLALHAANAALLPPLATTALEADMLTLLAASGAAAWGRALTGYGLFALVRGAPAAADLRAALTARLGLGPGRVLVTIADTDGARDTVRDQRPFLP